jgi:hypothetical protein
MKLLFLIIAVLFYSNSFGQADLNVQTNEMAQINDLENLVRAWILNSSIETKEVDVEGCPYLNEQFISGVVTLNSGIKYSGIPLRYNIYNDLIEFKSKSGKVFNINNPEAITELTIGDSKFIFTDCRSNKKNEKLFVEVISDYNVGLLKHYRMKLLDARKAETHKPDQPPMLVKIPSEYFIRKSDGTSQHFRNKKELLELLSDKSDKIDELIKQQKLSIKNENDLLAILKYYNEN